MRMFLAMILGLSFSLSANPLDSYLWKNRIFLIQLGENQDAVLKELQKAKAELEERHMVILNLGEPVQNPFIKHPTSAENQTLRKDFNFPDPNKTLLFVLVGKDGTEKARQLEELKLADFFAQIDRMPMRRAEMRR